MVDASQPASFNIKFSEILPDLQGCMSRVPKLGPVVGDILVKCIGSKSDDGEDGKVCVCVCVCVCVEFFHRYADHLSN